MRWGIEKKMKNNTLSAVTTLTVNGKTIEVRELRWRDYAHAVQMLTGSLLKLFAGKKGESITANREEIVEAIEVQQELIAWAITKSTHLTESEVSELSTREVLPIISAMIDLNLSEEITGPGKKLAGQMAHLLGLKIGSAKPSTTSSPTDTGSEIPST